MSQQRRLNPAPRARRRKRVPAYQLRQRHRDVPVAGPTQDTPPEYQSPAPRATNGGAPADSEITAQGTAPLRQHTGTEAFEIVPSADIQEPSPVTGEDAELADVADSVEQAAKRQKLQANATSAASVDAAVADRPGFHRVRPSSTDRRRHSPRKNQRGGNGPRGPRGRGTALAGGQEPDQRPLLKRPKTWFVMIGMVFAICAIVVVIWSLNIVRATYDAYNEMHVEPTPRTVYQVNPEGTAVPVPTEEVVQSLPDWSRSEPFNILLLGVDDRDGEDEPIRSDTLIVVRVDPTAKTVTMLSIPRDVLVWIPGFRMDKINAAYPLGEYYEVPGGGVALAAQTVEANFDIRIHYFITVDFTGFRRIVNTIGGVIVDVPAPVKDDQYPTETYGLTRAYFPTGLQKMDGETALRYARTRHGDNDIARGERQQQLLIAIREQAINLGLITRADDLIRDLGSAVRTDLNFNQLLALANLGRSIEPENIQRINLWEEGLIYEHWPEEEDDSFYFDADWAGVLWLVSQHFHSEAGTPSGPSPTNAEGEATPTLSPDDSVNLALPVVVQNATNVNLMATSATRILYNVGFSNVTPEDGTEVIPSSIIYDYAGSPVTARYIARQLGIDESSIVYGSGGAGIVVVLGEEYASQ